MHIFCKRKFSSLKMGKGDIFILRHQGGRKNRLYRQHKSRRGGGIVQLRVFFRIPLANTSRIKLFYVHPCTYSILVCFIKDPKDKLRKNAYLFAFQSFETYVYVLTNSPTSAPPPSLADKWGSLFQNKLFSPDLHIDKWQKWREEIVVSSIL